MWIDYLVNITVGFIQFLVIFALFQIKENKLKLLISATILLSMYTVLYINVSHIVNLWLMGLLYTLLAAVLMRFVHKIEFVKACTMAMIMVTISYMVEYALILLTEAFGYRIIYGKIRSDESDYLFQRVILFLVWFLVYFFILWANHRKRQIFETTTISWSRNFKYFLLMNIININQMMNEDIKLSADHKPMMLSSIVVVLLYFAATIYYSYVASAASEELTTEKLYNRSLNEMLDQMRDFKHNLGNLLDSIHGLAKNRRYEELCEFTQNLQQDYKYVVNKDIVNYHFKDTSVLYGIIISKIAFAELHHIAFEFNILAPIERYRVRSVDLARIIGILLDNAFEAAMESPEKKVRLTTLRENNQLIFVIDNTYAGGFDPERAFEKGTTGKQGHSGIGLYEVREIINSYKRRNSRVAIQLSADQSNVTARLTA